MKTAENMPESEKGIVAIGKKNRKNPGLRFSGMETPDKCVIIATKPRFLRARPADYERT
ncbi:MAG: hypothetical protein PUH36_08525 [Subdoligranulum sp.]|nr:hypothetical protein [Subdoligranulum sp.]